MTRRLYTDVMISIFPNNNLDYEVHIISDKLTDITGNLIVAVETLNGTMIYFDAVTNYELLEGASDIAYTISNETLAGIDITKTFIWAYFSYSGDVGFAQNQFYFVRPLELELEEPKITVTFDEKKQTVSLLPNKLAKDVYLYVDDMDVKFSDNYFDMLPGIHTTLTILNGINISKIKEHLKVISLYDSYLH